MQQQRSREFQHDSLAFVPSTCAVPFPRSPHIDRPCNPLCVLCKYE